MRSATALGSPVACGTKMAATHDEFGDGPAEAGGASATDPAARATTAADVSAWRMAFLLWVEPPEGSGRPSPGL